MSLQKPLVSVCLAVWLAAVPALGETPVAEPQVRQLVDTWLKAQNEGSFDTYKSLYAARFLGIKRSGPRTYRFDTADWLKDRQRMFAKKMNVEVSDLKVTVSSAGAVARFTQVWASGSYKDTGTKQLVVVSEGAGLKISREEMLESKLMGKGEGTVRMPREAFAFVVDAARAHGGPYVVLEPLPQEGWADTSALRLLSKDWPMVVGASATGLPAELGAWKGRRVALYGAQGRLCEGTVNELSVLTRVSPHFGMRQTWTGEGLEGEEAAGEKPTDAQIARELWDMGGDGRLLVGQLTVEAADGCPESALWAREASQPAPAIAALLEEKVLPDLKSTATSRFPTLAGFKAIQKEYLEARADLTDPPETAESWTGSSLASQTVQAFQDTATGKALLAISAEITAGCGFAHAFWAVWEVASGTATPQLVLLSDEGGTGSMFVPHAAFDANGDGTFELLGDDVLYSVVETRYRPIQTIVAPNFDCGC